MKDYYEMTQDDLVKETQRKDLEIQALRAGIECVRDLINNSSGVSGLRLNGDIATWEELQRGGRFEEWLIAFNDAEE